MSGPLTGDVVMCHVAKGAKICPKTVHSHFRWKTGFRPVPALKAPISIAKESVETSINIGNTVIMQIMREYGE